MRKKKWLCGMLGAALILASLGGCGKPAGQTADAQAGSGASAAVLSESGETAENGSAESVPEKTESVTGNSQNADPQTVSGSNETAAESADSAQSAGQEPLTAESALQEAGTTEPADKGITVALDPGHQAPDVDMSGQEPNAPGSSVMKTKATGGTSGTTTGVPEYQLNLDIALQVRDLLKAEGYAVVMTREDNETAISNAERATLANESGASVMVRIHANGSEDPGASGALALVGSSSNPYVGSLYGESSRLAEDVLSAYCSATGMADNGVITSDTMTGINWSSIPVMILEMGFMTNPSDDTNMEDPEFQKKMAEGIAQGIQNYFGR